MKSMLAAAVCVIAVILFCAPTIEGQKPAPIPRLADGKPDMQGYWTNQTFTPLERPAQWKDKTTLTVEEATAFAKTRLDDLADQPRGNEVQRDADIHYDDAIWMLEGYPKGAMLRTSIITDPPDGRIPPLSAEGQKRQQERQAARKGRGQFDDAQSRGLSERCIYWAHEGPPILPTGYNSNLQIHQGPQTFVVIPEMMPVARIVPLDGRSTLGAKVRGYRGDSRGRWDGDTMVIETTNYFDKTAWRGAGEHLKVTERFTMTSPKTIRYQFSVNDPTTWTRPWSGEYEMTRIDGPIYEYACHEGNYGLPSILQGARLAEEAAAKTRSGK